MEVGGLRQARKKASCLRRIEENRGENRGVKSSSLTDIQQVRKIKDCKRGSGFKDKGLVLAVDGGWRFEASKEKGLGKHRGYWRRLGSYHANPLTLKNNQ